MRTFAVLALACGLAVADYPVAPVTTYSTSTQYLTATVTLTQCDPKNPACPLYTPPPTTSSTSTSTSSVAISTSAVYSANTTMVYPTVQLNTTSMAYPTTVVPSVTPSVVGPPPVQSTIPVGGAGTRSVQAGLLLGAVGLGAVLLG